MEQCLELDLRDLYRAKAFSFLSREDLNALRPCVREDKMTDYEDAVEKMAFEQSTYDTFEMPPEMCTPGRFSLIQAQASMKSMP